MTPLKLKSNLQREQLMWFLALVLNERDIFRLLMQTNILADPDRLYSTSKQELLSRLTNALFKHSKIDRIVAEHLSKKAEAAIARVGYMVIDEIHTFFKSPGPLIESGEFGEVVWALLIDPREDVHLHGYNLLKTAYDNHNHPSNVPPLKYHQLYGSEEQHDLPDKPALNVSIKSGNDLSVEDEDLKNIDREQLQQDLTQLKAEFNSIKKKNTLLRDHCEFLIQENDNLKSKEGTHQENRKQVVSLQQENQDLHHKASQFDETNASLLQLESENRKLVAENQEIVTQLQELSDIKSAKEVFSVELKMVEEAVYKKYQALEQIKTDFDTHFDLIERSYTASQKALNQIRNTVNLIDSPQLEFGESEQVEDRIDQVGVFVDVQNLFYAAKDRYERRVDLIKLLDLIVGPRQLLTAFAYIVQIPKIKQSNFISLLEHNGYTIRSKDLRLRGDGSAKGDWDVGIAVDVVSMLTSLDVVILASGDGDFCPLAELIKQQHKRIEVVAFEHNTSMDLQAVADQFFPIGEELLM
ncbi:NYN domain-containing protein [Candidatus Poribacteria bacterium]|nr:NYN domain-containing protein [Candidatus Poribacteria bacterium]